MILHGPSANRLGVSYPSMVSGEDMNTAIMLRSPAEKASRWILMLNKKPLVSAFLDFWVLRSSLPSY